MGQDESKVCFSMETDCLQERVHREGRLIPVFAGVGSVPGERPVSDQTHDPSGWKHTGKIRDPVELPAKEFQDSFVSLQEREPQGSLSCRDIGEAVLPGCSASVTSTRLPAF